jgi:hypothetical protein
MFTNCHNLLIYKLAMDKNSSNNIIKIKRLVSESQTSDALSLLLEISQSNKSLHNAVHIVLGEFNDLTLHRLRGTIDNSEATKRLNIIHDKIFIALSSFDSEGKPLPNNSIPSSGKTTKFLLKLGLTIFSISLILAAIYVALNPSFHGDDYLMLMASAYFVGLLGIIVLGCWLIAVLFNAMKGN